MSNEEPERKMAFIVEQQAQFASDIQQLREAQLQTDQVVAPSGEFVARLANVTLEGLRMSTLRSTRWLILKSTSPARRPH